MTDHPMCSDCVAFWAKHPRQRRRWYCPCSPPKGPALVATVPTETKEPA